MTTDKRQKDILSWIEQESKIRERLEKGDYKLAPDLWEADDGLTDELSLDEFVDLLLGTIREDKKDE